ncbi:MAG: phytanoyl-CoA dioxygenase family protein [Verrucomicrobiota bacterium]|nr:phytanoyl-CoA dioxygenase family protein [Verrucomicrobiota bacterium]
MEEEPQIIESYNRDGFIAISSFFDTEKLEEIGFELSRFQQKIMPSLGSSEVYYEDKSNSISLKQIHRMHQHDSYFFDLMNDEPRHLAEVLLGEEVVPKNLQYFNKPPLLGLATPPHQDGYYFMLEPSSALTMWLALDVVDEENGCMRYVRGSHKKGMRLHKRTQTLGFSQGITDFGTEDDMANEIVCRAKPGDLLAHQAMTVHRADANNSISRNRRALGFIFYGTSAKENIEAYQLYKMKLEKELALEGKI